MAPSAAGAQSPRANGAERQILNTFNAQQVPPSPSIQQSPVTQATPSTVGAAGSPIQNATGPLIANADGVGAEAKGRRQEKETRMRSSIACCACRRSKTKCDNNGIRLSDGSLAPCKSCVDHKKECTYPAPAPAASQSQRRESTATTAGEEAPPKKRKRPVVPTIGPSLRGKGRLGSPEDALNSDLLTPKLWDELWAIHERHYSMEFPFLHKRAFLGPLQRLPPVSSAEAARIVPSQRTHDPALVLAFLTQTSPFHSELVAQTGSPHDTAEFYAAAALKHLDYSWSKQGDAAMQQIQAFLMLGYHAWSACHSIPGYMMIRQAIAFAGVHKYAYDGDATKRLSGNDPAARRDRFIREESQRRTFWSCFILDRILSVGKGRPRVIQVKDLRALQIPCSDKNFISGRAVRTRLFGETDEAYAKRRKEIYEEARQRNDGHEPPRIEWEDRRDDGMLGRWIYALDHFADVNEWSNNGGRRSERPNIGPWNPETAYYQLDKRLKEIKEELPDELQLTAINTENHVYETPSTTSRTYYLIHAILQLSTAYLYPEYLPTYGFRLKKPQGPMDAPLVTEAVPDDQPNYWEDKARECFEYVRDFVSMLRSFKDRDLIVESPFIAHAVYKAAWCAMYCFHVPKMDPSRALDAKLEPNAWDITNQVLGSMRRKFKLVNGMSRNLATVASIYTDRLREWRNSGGTPTSNFSDSDGGLNEYAEKFERAHKQFGSFEHDQEDLAYPTDTPYSRLKHEEGLSDPASVQSPVASFKTETDEPRRSTSSHSGFTPVNPNNAVTSVHVQQSNDNMVAPHAAQPIYSPPTSQAPQQPQASQSYPAQTLSYEQSPGYGYPGTTPTFPQTAAHYSIQPSYTRTPGPNPGQSNVSYNPQRMSELEKEGNASVRPNDYFIYQNEGFFSEHWGPADETFPPDLSASQFWSGQQPPYSSYPGQWPGQ